MFKEFFKKYKPYGIEKLSKARRNNIRTAVFSRINETEDNNVLISARRFKLKPAFIAAAAAVLAVTGVTVGALSSPPEVKLNGDYIEPYYNVYIDVDGATVEILAVELPSEMLGEEKYGMTPTGELKLGRSDIGDISKEGYSDIWLIDENGNEYREINNKLVSVKITLPDKSNRVHDFYTCNYNPDHLDNYSFSGGGYEYLFLTQETEVCGHTLGTYCAFQYDRDADATVEFIAAELPSEALGEPVPDCYFNSPVGWLISGAELKFFDEEGNRITPVLTDSRHTFPNGVNDLLIDIKITYSDGSVENMRLEPINKLEGFNYDEIELKYISAKYENMLDTDLWAFDENGEPISYADIQSKLKDN